MKIAAEEIVGGAVIVFLLFWIWKSGSGGTTIINRQAPVSSAPPLPAGSIYNFPPAPDLSHFQLPVVQGGSISLQRPAPPMATSPAPCICGCDGNGAATMVTQTVLDFTKSLTQTMGATFQTYLDNIVSALPVNVRQFIDNPDAVNASNILKQQVGMIGARQDTNIRVRGIQYTNFTQASVDLGLLDANGQPLPGTYNNLNNYVPGRVVVYG